METLLKSSAVHAHTASAVPSHHILGQPGHLPPVWTSKSIILPHGTHIPPHPPLHLPSMPPHQQYLPHTVPPLAKSFIVTGHGNFGANSGNGCIGMGTTVSGGVFSAQVCGGYGGGQAAITGG